MGMKVIYNLQFQVTLPDVYNVIIDNKYQTSRQLNTLWHDKYPYQILLAGLGLQENR